MAANLSHVDHGGNLQHNHSGGIHDTSHNRKIIYKKKALVKERDVDMSTVACFVIWTCAHFHVLGQRVAGVILSMMPLLLTMTVTFTCFVAQVE